MEKGETRMKIISRGFIILSLTMSSLGIAQVIDEEFDTAILQRLREGEVLSEVRYLSNSKVYQCRLMGLIPVSVNKVWSVISDYSHYYEFMPRTPVSFLVKPGILDGHEEKTISSWNRFEIDLKKHRVNQCKDNPFYFYNRFKLPFPLKDRHFVLKVERFPDVFKSQLTESLGNTPVNRGSWQLKSFENDPENTLAIYILYIDPGLFLPQPLIQKGMKKLPEVIRSLRHHILENEYREDQR
jgi:hypothetical protein